MHTSHSDKGVLVVLLVTWGSAVMLEDKAPLRMMLAGGGGLLCLALSIIINSISASSSLPEQSSTDT
jgi:hypothetical protein